MPAVLAAGGGSEYYTFLSMLNGSEKPLCGRSINYFYCNDVVRVHAWKLINVYDEWPWHS